MKRSPHASISIAASKFGAEWVSASEEMIRALTIAKQATDLHTSTLLQHAVARMLATFDYGGHLERLRSVYGARCTAMLRALEKDFPPGTWWTRPDGGLFLWVQLPGEVSGESLLRDALRERVAFVPGTSFFAHAPRHNFIRLNFSNRPPEIIEEGIRRIGSALKRRLGSRRARAS